MISLSLSRTFIICCRFRMNLRIFIIPIYSCLFGAFATAAEKTAGDKGLDRLIASLADENYKVREDAALDLWKLGDEALPALKSAIASGDPEKSSRARDISRRIELGITPETDPGIIDLVDRFAGATLEEKSTILGKLMKFRAWRQLLKLYATEESADVREELEPALEGVALRAAREAVLAGKPQAAREFLAWGSGDDSALLSHADFLRSQGLIDQELKKLPSGGGRDTERWRLAMLRALGNTGEASALALKLGMSDTAASMSALSGNPLPWLEHMAKQTQTSRITAAYAAAAASAWKGKTWDAADLSVFNDALSAKNPRDRDIAINALYALGQPSLAEPALIKHQPLIAFQHFDILERVPDAMRALGFNPDFSDANQWISEAIEEIIGRDIEDQHKPSDATEKVVALAYFNERRGLHDRNNKLFDEPVAMMAERNPERFLNLIGNLFGRGEVPFRASALALRIAGKWAGQEPNRWEALVDEVLGDEDIVTEWWLWLEELDPESGSAARFDAMLVIFGILNDSQNLRDKIIQQVWKAIDGAPEAEKARLLARMVTMGVVANDLQNTLKAVDRLPNIIKDAFPWESRLIWLSAAQRWGEVASLVLAQIGDASDPEHESVAELHAYAASSLRRAGRGKEAGQHDMLADQLSMGSPESCMRIGNGYAFGGEFKTARQWWARAACYADPEKLEDFSEILRPYAEVLLEHSDWSKSAAAFEVLNAIVIASEPRWQSPAQFSRMRLHADLSFAISRLKDDRKRALAMLDRCHANAPSDGSLADFFLPAVRAAGLGAEHDAWYRKSSDYLCEMIVMYPDADNLRNTAAWLASRANRDLDQAEKDMRAAISLNAKQAAYLDTMAEIQFAKGDRAKAIEWSNRAMELAPGDEQIRKQAERFRSGNFPTK